MWENCHDYNPELEKEWNYKAKDVPRMNNIIGLIGSMIHRLKNSGLSPVAIFASPESFREICGAFGANAEDEVSVELFGLPVYRCDMPGTFLIGV